MGSHRGQFSGVAGRQEMIAKCHDHTVAGDRLKLHPPTFTLTDGTLIMFEFEADGLYASNPYKGHNAIAFEIEDDKVVSFREYFGDLDR